jgi:hypothetical protein
MGFQGNKFTWWNGWHGDDCVYERLDRGVCSADWKLLFPFAQVRHIPFTNSDHDAILVVIQKSVMSFERKPQQFPFENNWLQVDGCEKVVREAWQLPQQGYLLYQVCQRIKVCRVALIKWSQAVKRPTQKRVAQLQTICNDLEKTC